MSCLPTSVHITALQAYCFTIPPYQNQKSPKSLASGLSKQEASSFHKKTLTISNPLDFETVPHSLFYYQYIPYFWTCQQLNIRYNIIMKHKAYELVTYFYFLDWIPNWLDQILTRMKYSDYFEEYWKD